MDIRRAESDGPTDSQRADNDQKENNKYFLLSFKFA